MNPRLVGVDDLAGRRAHIVEFTDSLGEPFFAYYSLADTLPLGFRVTHTDPDVIVTIGGWEAHGPLRLFTSASFAQGGERYEYSNVDIRLNGIPDSVFVGRTRLLQSATPQ